MWNACVMCAKCLRHVCDMYVKCVRHVCDMYVKCVRHVCDMYVRCVWEVFDMYVRCVWEVFDMCVVYCEMCMTYSVTCVQNACNMCVTIYQTINYVLSNIFGWVCDLKYGKVFFAMNLKYSSNTLVCIVDIIVSTHHECRALLFAICYLLFAICCLLVPTSLF